PFMVPPVAADATIPEIALRHTVRQVDLSDPLHTALTLNAMHPDLLVVRHPHSGAVDLLAQKVNCAVINAGDLLRVRDAGGRFSFSPGISPELLSASAQEGITFIPGVATASELMAAINAGISGCKLFPATAVGGVELLKGFAGPFPEMRFCPTGGVSLANMNDFLSLPNVSCVGGSWIVPKAEVGAGAFEKITALCKEALGSVRS
ncbi:MAG: bifunctional 4-hydroxy-2-oxoglutarate aldolase/2-dehydro-3-deoxy-phosphogluconate aldolase, partial [Campylobacterales bacterium]|nr:bifunctional 4-hydroxy-2-oxoglutarate aldolase/2-dehydro-3-deoxy-phosphogluconate aldolase [Campylobacterales bacterium]